ncbi:hypothetical protein AB0J86_16470 [Micromonospora sp. NPDC049559]|uniref:hypothetical protein n=1 Tax=Micromonospora sp. NPDC049559 TaxID=3155923 RepID=UPI0034452BAB
MTGAGGHDPANDEVRGRGLADRLLRVASRRWPVELREAMLAEWRAELAAIGADRTLRRLVRVLRRLRFALSLAGSPPVEDEQGVPRGWRELLPEFGKGLRPVLMLLGATLLCDLLGWGARDVSAAVLAGVRGGPPSFSRDGIDWAGNVATLAGLVLATGLAALVGAALGRRLPVAWAHRGRLGAAGSALVAPLVLAAGMGAQNALWWAQQDPGVDDGTVTVLAAETGPALLLWAALIVPVAVLTVRLVERGRRGRGWLVGVVGGLLALEFAAVLAGRHVAAVEGLSLTTSPWWFPLSLLETYGGGIRFGPVEQGSVASETVVDIVAGTLRPLLTATAFVLLYGVRAARATTADRAARATTAAPTLTPADGAAVAPPAPVTVPPGHRRLGLVALAAGLALWAYAATILTPQLAEVARVDAVQSWELHLWVQELREAAIVLGVLGLVVAAATRGPVLLPGLLVAALLVTVDSVLDTVDAGGPAALAGALALAAGVAGAGRWAVGALAGQRGVSEAEVRRRLAWVAAAAALLAPAPLMPAAMAGSLTPVGYPAVTAALAGLLAALAAAGALAARPGRLPSRLAVPLVAAPGLLLATLGALTTTVRLDYSVTLGLPLVAYALALATARRERWAVPRWVGIALGAALLGLPAVYVQLALGVPAGMPLIRAAGYGNPVDGLPYFPGAVILALPVAALVARLAASASHTADGAPARAAGRSGAPAGPDPDPA